MTTTGDPEGMQSPPITCESVDREDLDTRYLRGMLDGGQAEAFEAHFFGCDRCWELVQRGIAVRAARPVRASRTTGWVLAAAALVLGVVGIGIWTQTRPADRSGPGIDRSATDGLAPLRVGINQRSLTVSWARVPNAASFRVRLYRADGSLSLQRETADTNFTLPLDSLGPATRTLFCQVHALDQLGAELVRFPLAEIRR